jgi:hypothetical protein
MNVEQVKGLRRLDSDQRARGRRRPKQSVRADRFFVAETGFHAYDVDITVL